MLYVATICSLLALISSLIVVSNDEETNFSSILTFVIFAIPFGYLMCEVIDRIFA